MKKKPKLLRSVQPCALDRGPARYEAVVALSWTRIATTAQPNPPWNPGRRRRLLPGFRGHARVVSDPTTGRWERQKQSVRSPSPRPRRWSIEVGWDRSVDFVWTCSLVAAHIPIRHHWKVPVFLSFFLLPSGITTSRSAALFQFSALWKNWKRPAQFLQKLPREFRLQNLIMGSTILSLGFFQPENPNLQIKR